MPNEGNNTRTRVAITAVRLAWTEIAMCAATPKQDICPTLAAAQTRLNELAALPAGSVAGHVHVVAEWQDGHSHPVRYRLGHHTDMVAMVHRYFSVYAGEIGGLSESEKDAILPPVLRERYSVMLATHLLA
jgi:hypothetical protein